MDLRLQYLRCLADVAGGPSLVQVALIRRTEKSTRALGSVIIDAPACAPKTSYGSVQRAQPGVKAKLGALPDLNLR